MVTTTIEPGNFYITTGEVNTTKDTIDHDSGKAVEIFSPLIEYTLIDQSKVRPIPMQGGNVGTDEPVAFNTGLKVIIETARAVGVLVDETGETAKAKRNNILSMIKNDKELTIVWGTGADRTLWFRDVDNREHGVGVSKVRFSEKAGKYSISPTDTSPFRKIDIDITVIRSKNLSEKD